MDKKESEMMMNEEELYYNNMVFRQRKIADNSTDCIDKN